MKAAAALAAMLAAAVATALPCAAQTPARTPTAESMAVFAVACIDHAGDQKATRKWAEKAGIPGRGDEIAKMGHGVTDMWRLMTPAGAKVLLLLTKEDTCHVLSTKFDANEAFGLIERSYHAKLLRDEKGQGHAPERRFYKVAYAGATMMLAITDAADDNSLSSMVVYSEARLRRDGMWGEINGH